MQHPLATPVASVGLLALTLHLVLPLLCEIWRYYPNKITGKEMLKNWYLERVRAYRVDYYDWKLPIKYGLQIFVGNQTAYKTFYESSKEDHSIDIKKQSNISIVYYTAYISTRSIVAVIAALLIEYLLANFFIYTLVAGLAVGLHFTVVLLGKKLYSVSEDVKALKEHNKKGNNDDD
jgi:hypothetical protein